MYITGIGSYIPCNFLDNFAQAQKFSKSPDFITSKIGAFKLPRKYKYDTSATLAVNAIQNLKSNFPFFENDIDLICVVTQNPHLGGIPHTSAIVHGLGGFPSTCNSFDISLGCSGYIYGLSIVSSFLYR